VELVAIYRYLDNQKTEQENGLRSGPGNSWRSTSVRTRPMAQDGRRLSISSNDHSIGAENALPSVRACLLWIKLRPRGVSKLGPLLPNNRHEATAAACPFGANIRLISLHKKLSVNLRKVGF
jgi:hypothetical protein